MIRHPFDRFDDLYIPEPNSGCWLWIGQLNNKGYGKFCLARNISIYAHRFSYQVHNNIEVPSDIDVCHSCDVPCCVNPDHLWAGSRKDNMQDCLRKGRFEQPNRRGMFNGRATLSEHQVIAIFHDRRTGREISKDYGCGKHAVFKIKSGKTWAYLTKQERL